MKKMGRKPLVSPTRLDSLISKYQKSRSSRVRLRLRNRIVLLLTPLVRYIAGLNGRGKVDEDARLDMQQEALVRLLEVVPKYNRSRGSPFNFFFTCILNCCRGELSRNQRTVGLDGILATYDFDRHLVATTLRQNVFSPVRTQHVEHVLGGHLLGAYEYIKRHLYSVAERREFVRRTLLKKFKLTRRDADFLLDFVTFWLRLYAYERVVGKTGAAK